MTRVTVPLALLVRVKGAVRIVPVLVLPAPVLPLRTLPERAVLAHTR
jgi:hypothetical protein